MIFEEVLPILRAGRSIRRNSWAPRMQIRMVDPLREPDVDGPTDIFNILVGGYAVERGFETEAAAKKALTALKKAHDGAWKKYDDAEKAFADAPVEKQEQIKRGATPQFPREHYESAAIEKVDAPRTRRLNVPYFVMRDAKSANIPYVFSVPDILATDWNEA